MFRKRAKNIYCTLSKNIIIDFSLARVQALSKTPIIITETVYTVKLIYSIIIAIVRTSALCFWWEKIARERERESVSSCTEQNCWPGAEPETEAFLQHCTFWPLTFYSHWWDRIRFIWLFFVFWKQNSKSTRLKNLRGHVILYACDFKWLQNHLIQTYWDSNMKKNSNISEEKRIWDTQIQI